jgi:hypothetical protein
LIINELETTIYMMSSIKSLIQLDNILMIQLFQD